MLCQIPIFLIGERVETRQQGDKGKRLAHARRFYNLYSISLCFLLLLLLLPCGLWQGLPSSTLLLLVFLKLISPQGWLFVCHIPSSASLNRWPLNF